MSICTGKKEKETNDVLSKKKKNKQTNTVTEKAVIKTNNQIRNLQNSAPCGINYWYSKTLSQSWNGAKIGYHHRKRRKKKKPAYLQDVTGSMREKDC